MATADVFLHVNGLFASCSRSSFLVSMIDRSYRKAASKRIGKKSFFFCLSAMFHLWLDTIALIHNRQLCFRKAVVDFVNIFIRIMGNVNHFICCLILISCTGRVISLLASIDRYNVSSPNPPGINCWLRGLKIELTVRTKKKLRTRQKQNKPIEH